MAANRFVRLFDSCVHRELTGQRVVIAAQTKPAIVRELRETYRESASIDEKLQLLFLMETLGADLGEMGFNNDDVDFLLNTFNITTSFKAIAYAAKLKTNHINRPALSMAGFYANELDSHNEVFPGMTSSFSSSYHAFFNLCSHLETTVHRASLLNGTLVFAELGSKLAITNLIKWYQYGFMAFGIEPDAEKAAHWQQRLNGVNKQLLDSFHDYFQLEMERIVRFENNHEALSVRMRRCRDFCIAQGQTQFNEMAPPDFFKHFIKLMANKNNMYAMNFLMASARDNTFPYAGRAQQTRYFKLLKWGQKIVETVKTPCQIAAEATYFLYALYYQDDLDGCIKLLTHAHAMGCTKSMSCLVSVYIKKGCIDKALAAMEHVFTMQLTPQNILTITKNVTDIIWNHPSLVSAYVDFVILNPVYLRYELIEKRLYSVGEYELCNRLIGIRRNMIPVEDLPAIAERTKEVLVKSMPVKRLKM